MRRRLALAPRAVLLLLARVRAAEAQPAAARVARIGFLYRATPAQLPFEPPANYRLFVNKKTARALGLEIPSEVLVRADGVFE